jgi:hypothetical protein
MQAEKLFYALPISAHYLCRMAENLMPQIFFFHWVKKMTKAVPYMVNIQDVYFKRQ